MDHLPFSNTENQLSLAGMRRDYSLGTLKNTALHDDPIQQFDIWFQEALSCQQVLEANAMVLATTSRDLQITSRTVLLKGYDLAGFRFFTNSTSTKGKQIAENPRVALLFHWHALERQIHINGHVTLLPRSETEKYFQSRPRQSQIAAWTSYQSSPLSSREELEERFEKVEARFENQIIPTPEFWNGYLVVPDKIEFWQGRSNRLHDRFCYTKKENGGWKIERLSP
ncbi:MAG: pyridoxamine 5'-phosphate oxidase [Verrucomicrobia bacterium]|nr:pyridoxamine 5'-phosphate oxidase [Verrucomicrobiota bacterium]